MPFSKNIMQIKLLENIVAEISGKQGVETIKLLFGKRDVNEFLIAKKLNLTINQVRNILYKLSNFNLVTFTRKKDKRKGWYTYFWTLDNERSLDLLATRLGQEIETLNNQLKSRETKRFYYCKTCKTEVGEENALLHQFTCPECGEVFELSDNSKHIEELKKSIIRLEGQRAAVISELDLVKIDKKKKIDTKDKNDAKKKKSEKDAKKKIAQKEKEKLNPKNSSKKKK